jgi:hypothetical protein
MSKIIVKEHLTALGTGSMVTIVSSLAMVKGQVRARMMNLAITTRGSPKPKKEL